VPKLTGANDRMCRRNIGALDILSIFSPYDGLGGFGNKDAGYPGYVWRDPVPPSSFEDSR